MNFTKIKYNGDVVELEWGKERDDGSEVSTRFKCFDAPLEDFKKAMIAFRALVAHITDLPGEWVTDLAITGLSINTEKDGRRGLVITAMKKLPTANSPLILNTPHLRELVDEPPGPGFFVDGMDRAIERAEKAATEYLKGKREQVELFS